MYMAIWEHEKLFKLQWMLNNSTCDNRIGVVLELKWQGRNKTVLFLCKIVLDIRTAPLDKGTALACKAEYAVVLCRMPKVRCDRSNDEWIALLQR